MKKGFTLSEVLLALTIIGIVATLTVPALMNNVHNKMFAAQVKNMTATIEQLAQDELIAKRTRDLSDTDFGDTTKLLSDDHFSITKSCTTASDAEANCWKTTATGKNLIVYKNLNKSNISDLRINRTIILKNGVMITCNKVTITDSIVEDTLLGCTMDVNGNDKPNIGGRDLFRFFITRKGHIVDYYYIYGQNKTLEQKQNSCKSNYNTCYGALADNGWKMDY